MTNRDDEHVSEHTQHTNNDAPENLSPHEVRQSVPEVPAHNDAEREMLIAEQPQRTKDSEGHSRSSSQENAEPETEPVMPPQPVAAPQTRDASLSLAMDETLLELLKSNITLATSVSRQSKKLETLQNEKTQSLEYFREFVESDPARQAAFKAWRERGQTVHGEDDPEPDNQSPQTLEPSEN